MSGVSGVSSDMTPYGRASGFHAVSEARAACASTTRQVRMADVFMRGVTTSGTRRAQPQGHVGAARERTEGGSAPVIGRRSWVGERKPQRADGPAYHAAREP